LDLKPDNVFINQYGDLKIGDFGLCKSVTTKKGAVSTIQGNSYGTEGFMAPEIVKGKAVTTKADVYSFGVIVFYCVMLRGVEKTDPLPLQLNARLWPNNGNRAVYLLSNAPHQ
jgi:serine/threonine protein kinase